MRTKKKIKIKFSQQLQNIVDKTMISSLYELCDAEQRPVHAWDEKANTLINLGLALERKQGERSLAPGNDLSIYWVTANEALHTTTFYFIGRLPEIVSNVKMNGERN